MAFWFAATSIAEPLESAKEFRPVCDVEEGGVVPNEGRGTVNKFFERLKRTESEADERELLSEMAKWLNENGYKIEVEIREGVHRLACPYFPPITPWIDYRFRSLKNLKILPHRTRPLPD